ncbi:Predicted arabinose efflux permease, MFS family [Saccharopolyspora antimicrobica]|uniref:MFS family arabinose efflux permease n=1 Tax=Saccharopolyspora antimicrobica TaxID=455193 RepID=A0A1I4U8M9_9PSEU|nr:MFS transporter [Saccharopolyspora antimicrobica]RKT88731.1 putative MFS family arabinose efflux permease [Saccharopolyspora antimicrobica]SFM85180.1 Predicted arabinose efflux permease, MFS family [Saccharopolyspora antimicrobica]
MKTWRLIRSFPPAVQLLLVNQFGVNTGFYLLVPFLAGYLGHELGLSAALIGVVLGVRNLSQQGLFLLGGSASDRLGARGVIIAGCALRTVGFGLFAFGTSPPALLIASVLSGLAGALFNPAVRAYIAQEAGERRAEAFSLFNVFANTGMLLGPLLGSALMLVGFRLSAIAAAVVFALLTLAQLAVLPPRRVERPSTSVFADWHRALTDRRFLAFTGALTGMFALQNQLYLVLPMHAERFTGSPAAVSMIFLVSTAASLALQVRITTRAKERWSQGRCIATGLAVMGAGFAVTAVAATVIPPGPSAGPVGTALRLAPVLITAFALALGVMLAQPFVYELIPSFGGDRLSGTYFGVFYLVSGVTAAGGNALLGWMSDLAGNRWPWLPSLLCVLIGTGSALAVALLDRRRGITPGHGGADETRCSPRMSARSS